MCCVHVVSAYNRVNYFQLKIILPQPNAVIRWFNQLLEALVFLEQNCVVHRDLKLENLLLSADGNLIVSDFGKAILLDQSLSIPFMHGMNSVTAIVTSWLYVHNL